jgi:hypothetical protein
VLIKGVYKSSPGAFTDGKIVPLLVDSYGRVIVTIDSGSVNVNVAGEYNSTLPTISDGAEDNLQLDVGGRLICLPHGQYNSSLPTMSNGDKGVVQLDVNGKVRTTTTVDAALPAGTNSIGTTVWNPTAVNTYTADVFTNVGANTTLNVKATAGNVFSISCLNTNAAARYFQLFNTATTPAGAATAVYSWLIPAAGMIVLGTDFFTQNGLYFSTGIAFAYSTTFLTYTAATAAEQVTCVRYK